MEIKTEYQHNNNNKKRLMIEKKMMIHFYMIVDRLFQLFDYASLNINSHNSKLEISRYSSTRMIDNSILCHCCVECILHFVCVI